MSEKVILRQGGMEPVNLGSLVEENKTDENELAVFFGVEPQTISRWISGATLPSLRNYIRLAEFYSVSLEYLLGNTDVVENDITAYDVKLRVKALREENEYSRNKLATLVGGVQARNIVMYEEGSITRPRLSTFIKFADIFEVSIDYLFGFTDNRTWDEYARKKYPFKYIKPGGALCIREGERKVYALLDVTGEEVLFADGSIRSVDDEYFAKNQVEEVAP